MRAGCVVARKVRIIEGKRFTELPDFLEEAAQFEGGERVADEGVAIWRAKVRRDGARRGGTENAAGMTDELQKVTSARVEDVGEFCWNQSVDVLRRCKLDTDDVRRDSPVQDVCGHEEVVASAVDSNVAEGFGWKVIGEAEENQAEDKNESFEAYNSRQLWGGAIPCLDLVCFF